MEENILLTDNIKVKDYTLKGNLDKYLTSIIGKSFSKYRDKWRKAVDQDEEYDFPLFLVFETFYRCNLKCIMCIHSNEKKSSIAYDEQLSYEVYERIMKEASENYCPSMTLGGLSEPLLDKRMADMVALANRSGFVDIMINTNATLLTQDISRKLIENGLTRLRIGFDAATKETYESIRVGAKYENVKRNILDFIELRNRMNSQLPIVRISCVELSVNEKEIDEYVDFWKSIVDYVSIQRYRPHEFTEDRKRASLGSGEKLIKNARCSEPWNRLYIRGNGDVMPCCNPGYASVVGNVTQQSLKEIWNSTYMKKMRKALKEGNIEQFPKCKKCMMENYGDTQ